ncbi:MAG: hypothetical protein EBS32_11585 [Actinobacteria bacterium]|nr:hypothetical protein [Actinomycetota bacterium]
MFASAVHDRLICLSVTDTAVEVAEPACRTPAIIESSLYLYAPSNTPLDADAEAVGVGLCVRPAVVSVVSES